MVRESSFVETVMIAAKEILPAPLKIYRGAALLYQVTVDNDLTLTVDPKKPMRGNSAFQTDLCVFEVKGPELEIPRVVMEFKTSLTTHDVLTYSTKARKHKQVYPYLRYGLIVEDVATVPGRLFTHNEALDFCLAAAAFKAGLLEALSRLLKAEVETSRLLEKIAFGDVHAQVFRTEIIIMPSTKNAPC